MWKELIMFFGSLTIITGLFILLLNTHTAQIVSVGTPDSQEHIDTITIEGEPSTITLDPLPRAAELEFYSMVDGELVQLRFETVGLLENEIDTASRISDLNNSINRTNSSEREQRLSPPGQITDYLPQNFTRAEYCYVACWHSNYSLDYVRVANNSEATCMCVALTPITTRRSITEVFYDP